VRLVAIILLAATGCFYLDPINERPSITIVPESSETAHRGDTVILDAQANDPEGQYVAFTWHIQACEDATNVETCTPAFFTWVGPKATFQIPPFLDDTNKTPTSSVRVVLEGVDDAGATAKPAQTLVIPVVNALPDVKLRVGSRRVVGNPVDIFASVGDADDGPGAVQLTWQLYSPMSPPPALADIPNVSQPDPHRIDSGKTFIPDVVGEWTIEVTAADRPGDPLAPKTVEQAMFVVAPDHAPCLGVVAPAVPTGTQPLPMFDPTLFQVLVVNDDLDPYPGAAEFSWSLKPAGATQRAPIGSTNSVALDPASFTPGDIVELRVEIADRKHTPVNCPDGNATCSVISDPTCIQRQTWRVEVR
jgi:hypothetical protein